MKALVCISNVPGTASKIRFKDKDTVFDTNGVFQRYRVQQFTLALRTTTEKQVKIIEEKARKICSKFVRQKKAQEKENPKKNDWNI